MPTRKESPLEEAVTEVRSRRSSGELELQRVPEEKLDNGHVEATIYSPYLVLHAIAI